MTPSAQRIAIAEAHGFTEVRFKHRYNRETEPLILVGRHPRNTVSPTLVPDYPSDLNAMHEAWMAKINNKISPNGEAYRYLWRKHLQLICLRDEKKVGTNSTSNATAAQRAEAFLRTIGKWDDSK